MTFFFFFFFTFRFPPSDSVILLHFTKLSTDWLLVSCCCCYHCKLPPKVKMCLSKIYSISTIFSPFPPMLIALTTEYSANRRTSFQQQKREGKLWELACNFNFISTGCILLPFYILFGHYNITTAAPACLILNFPKEEGGKERERENASAEFAKEVSGNSAFIIIIKITIGFLIRLHQQQLRKGFVECLHC